MAKDDYVPRQDAKFLRLHDTFKAGAAELGATFGLEAEDLTQINNDNAELHQKMAASLQAEADAAAAASAKNATRRAAETNLRRLARQIKAHKNYTAARGVTFGIEGPESSADLREAKPAASATAQSHGVVELDFVKGDSEGVNIYSQREGDSEFVFLARDTYTPYTDTRPPLTPGKPELRRYYLVYVKNDEEVGQRSSIIEVVAKP